MLYKRGTPPRVYPFLCVFLKFLQKGACILKVNGEMISLGESISLKNFLENSGYMTGKVAVELNGNIVPKSSFESTMLTEADTLEIVHFVGGG